MNIQQKRRICNLLYEESNKFHTAKQLAPSKDYSAVYHVSRFLKKLELHEIVTVQKRNRSCKYKIESPYWTTDTIESEFGGFISD